MALCSKYKFVFTFGRLEAYQQMRLTMYNLLKEFMELSTNRRMSLILKSEFRNTFLIPLLENRHLGLPRGIIFSGTAGTGT